MMTTTAPDPASDHKIRNRSFSWRTRLDGSFFLYEYSTMDPKLFEPQLGKLIGEGSMAYVYQLAGDDDRVVKLSRSESFNETLLKEARLSSELQHQAFLPIDDFGVNDEGLAWVILPRLSGRNLKQMSLEPKRTLELMSLVADSLDVLHQSGWLHGDVKPTNLLEGNEETPVFLADLGLASRQGEPQQGGSPAYISPSRIAGEAPSSGDDHFAFAVSLYELLSGKLPFVDAEGEGLLISISRHDVHPLSTFCPAFPPELDELFSKAFAMEGFNEGLLHWVDLLRNAFGLQPALASLFYIAPELSDDDLLSTSRSFLSQPFEGDTRLGRVVLLKKGGRREAELLSTQLGISNPDLWPSTNSENARQWIAFMESQRPGDCLPHSAILSSLGLDAEATAYLTHRSDTLVLEPSQWRLEDLPAYLERGLHSRSNKIIAFGADELRFIREACRGDLDQAEEALNFLLEHGLLKTESGHARFVAPFRDWESKWRDKTHREGLSNTATRLLDILASLGAPLSEDECREVMGLGSKSISWVISELEQAGCIDMSVDEDLIQVRGRPNSEFIDYTLDQSMFPVLWKRCGQRLESKLLLLAQAVRQNVSQWLSKLPSKIVLELADTVSLSVLSDFCHRISGMSLPGSLGILPCVERFRANDLPEALKIFWLHESELDLPESAELSRRLVNDLIDHKSTEEGLECQDRWKRARGKEIEGSEFEVRVAAREAMSHGRMGSMDSALELLKHYKKQFAGRDGFYYLDWAEGLIHRDRRDRLATANAIQSALARMPEEAEIRDRFSLHIQLAGSFTLLGDLKQALVHLDHAEALMERSKSLDLGMHVSLSRGLYEKTKGNLDESIRLYSLAIRQAKENGSWQVPMVIQTNLVYALLRRSDFSRLMPLFREISRQVEVTDQISNATAGRLALGRICTVMGRFEEALKHLDECLVLAEETGSGSGVVKALLRRVYLFRLREKYEAANADLERLARDYLGDMSIDDRMDMRLESLLCEEHFPEDLEEEELAAILFSSKETDNEILHAEALLARMILRRRRGDLPGAQSASEEALAFVKKLDAPSLLWPIYVELGEVNVLLGKQSAARRSFGQALEIIEGLSRRISNGEDRDCFLSRPDRAEVLERYQTSG